MKKFMYFLPMAAFALASCSNDDSPVQSAQEQLSSLTDQLVLRPALQNANTRVVQAYSSGDNSFKEFYLTATGNFRDNKSSTADPITIVQNIDDYVTNVDGNQWLLKSLPAGKSYWWNDSDTKATFSAYAPKDEVEAAVADFIKNPAGTYNLALVDIGSPELDGYSVAHCIRLSCKDDASTIPVFAISNKSASQSGSMLKENGIDEIFSKPVEYGMLFLKMHEAMARAFGLR